MAEIWRSVDDEIRILHLGEDGTYTRSRSSRFLPVEDRDVRRWVLEEDRSDEAAWEERLAAWARRLPRRKGPG